MNNLVVWFEISVKNLERAMKFYSTVMSVELKAMDIGPIRQATFPFAPGVASGSLKESKESEPSESGTLIYLNGGEDLSAALARVEAAGGKVFKKENQHW